MTNSNSIEECWKVNNHVMYVDVGVIKRGCNTQRALPLEYGHVRCARNTTKTIRLNIVLINFDYI